MSAESAVLAGRVLAEQQMVDACTIRRPDGTEVTDPNTGNVVPGEADIYSGKCRVQNRAPRARTPVAGEVIWPEHLVELQIPVGVVGIRVGDVALMTASSLDPDLVGRRFRVTSPAHKSQATARRMLCEEGGSVG